MNRSHDNLPPELESVGRLLEQKRPQLSPIELDGTKQRVMSRVARGTESSTKGNFMKSRLAIVAMLATGAFMSGTGATLAVDGLSSTNNATSAQYGTTTTTPPATPTVSTGGGEVLGDIVQSNPGGDIIPGPPEAPAGEAADEPRGGGGERPATPAQETRQVELGAPVARLPFTGYAGITVLLLGLALLSTGLVMRRRTRLQ